MGKLSALLTETTATLSDFIVKVKSSGAGDVLVTMQNFITFLFSNPASPYKFSVYRAAALTPGSAAIIWDTVLVDSGLCYDTTTGRYTAKVAGWYYFNSTIQMSFTAANIGIAGSLFKNGSAVKTGNIHVVMYAGTYNDSVNVHGLVQLAVGDYVQAVESGASGKPLVVGSAASYFEGWLHSL